jgi:hypothetical protein
MVAVVRKTVSRNMANVESDQAICGDRILFSIA